MENPAGIDETAPRLSWILEARGRGRVQSAYQIVVSGDREGILSGRGDLWDTGKVPSSGTVHIEYAGRPLESGSRYYWRVRVWDEKDVPSPWSHVATWSMGLLQEDRWQGKWIGFDTGLGEDGTRLPLPPPVYLRKTFSLREPPGKASLYVTAMGLFEVYINGKRVGRDLFTPGWSSYRKRVYYRTYDVTDLLLEGPNAIGVILADGWYAGYVGFEPPGQNQWKGREFYGQTPALLLRLEMTGADGSLKALVSDESWRASTGPILEADILMGETYDARLEMPGWAEGGFDDSDWSRASPVAVPPARIAAYPAPPVREVGTVKPQKVTSPIPGVHIFDMGQNFAGRVRLRVSGKGGSGITLRYGEMLSADGTVMTQNLRSARAVDTYVLKGGGVEVWEPRFTYHGFRYLQVEGLGPDPPPETVTGVALSSDLEVTGSISSSSGLVDRLFEAIMRTQRSNFLEIPTDCPQRDERLGWSGDAHLFARTAAYNMDVAAFLTKWLEALRD
ncbi:MAG: family 78 glycoside hydrolase catalytic domain, partial [bacterium]